MWQLLSGQQHQVLTAVALVYGDDGQKIAVNRSLVTFRELEDAELQHDWESGEPRDKAGAYAIQGYGAVFVRHLSGSYSAVMGLPLFETHQLMRDAEII